jgi:hypothetical protein
VTRRGARLTAVWALVMAALATGGCKSPIDWLNDRAPRTTTVGARVAFANGEVLFYRYTQGTWCGEGVSYGGGGGSGHGPCDSMGGLTMSGNATGGLAMLYGRVNDPAITKVVLTLDSGTTVNASLGDGVWYVLFPAATDIPRATKLEGFYVDGNRIYSMF